MSSSEIGARMRAIGVQLDRIAELERRINQLHAEQLEAINAFDEATQQFPFELDKNWVADDLAAALRLSTLTAQDRLLFARELQRMPRLLELMRRGEITMMHARVATRETVGLDRQQLDAVLDRVLDEATQQTVGEFGSAVRRAAIAVGANPAERRKRALADRRISARPAPDGMSDLYGYLAAPDVAAIMTKIDDAARRMDADDTRTLEQKRADAFVEFLLGEKNSTAVMVNVVTVAESTLAGRDDEPAQLSGHGPISAEHARELAGGDVVSYRRLTTDPAGHLLDFGRTSRTPPARLDRFVRARDVTCRFPGCTRPARTAEVDHVVAWSDGGHTSAANLQALCKRHHHLKHEAGWRVRRHRDGTTTWISRTGHRYVVPPHTYDIRRGGPDPPV